MDEFGCCSQGLVLPRGTVLNLVNWFEEKKLGFVDMLTEEYGNLFGDPRWAVTPSVIQHVGGKTSKEDAGVAGRGRSEAETIWNFGFELNNAQQLRKDHESVIANAPT